MGLMSVGVFAADRTIDSPTADSWTTWFGPTMTDTSNTGDCSVQNTATVSANNYEVTSNPVISKIYTPISVTLNGKKTLTGRDMTAGEFEFVVMEDDTIVSEGTNDADGNIVFDEITYLAPGGTYLRCKRKEQWHHRRDL